MHWKSKNDSNIIATCWAEPDGLTAAARFTTCFRIISEIAGNIAMAIVAPDRSNIVPVRHWQRCCTVFRLMQRKKTIKSIFPNHHEWKMNQDGWKTSTLLNLVGGLAWGYVFCVKTWSAISTSAKPFEVAQNHRKSAKGISFLSKVTKARSCGRRHGTPRFSDSPRPWDQQGPVKWYSYIHLPAIGTPKAKTMS